MSIKQKMFITRNLLCVGLQYVLILLRLFQLGLVESPLWRRPVEGHRAVNIQGVVKGGRCGIK